VFFILKNKKDIKEIRKVNSYVFGRQNIISQFYNILLMLI
jgi:hypothetical protein